MTTPLRMHERKAIAVGTLVAGLLATATALPFAVVTLPLVPLDSLLHTLLGFFL
jgi:hypothetical protein